MTEQFANFAQSTLAASIGTSATIISVANASNFPLLGTFRIVVQVFDSNGIATSNPELMIVNSVAGNNFTVTRGAESTTAIGFPSGAKVTHILTAAVMQALSTGGGSSPLTTKGDVYGYSTTNARIPVGANGTVLTADSTQALGLKWAPSAGGGTIATTPNLLIGDSAGNAIAAGAGNITSSSASALTVGANGATNPALKVDASTASSSTGIVIKSAAAGAGVTLTAISSAADENVTLASKGTNGSAALMGGASVSFNVGGGQIFGGSVTQDAFTNFDRSFTSNTGFLFTGIAGTSLTASTESTYTDFNLAANQQHATGAIATQRDFRIRPSTHAAVAASTITAAHGVYIDGAPIAGTNASITESNTLTLGANAVGAGVATSYGLTVNPNTGATTNIAARFLGSTIVSSAAATSFAVGANGLTNPAFLVDDSTASSATGLGVKSAAAAGGVALTAISSGTNEDMTINGKGTGLVKINGGAIPSMALQKNTSINPIEYFSGEWYDASLSNQAVTATGITANRLYLHNVMFGQDLTIQNIGLYFTIGAAAATVQYVIYECDPVTGSPYNGPVYQSGTVSPTGTNTLYSAALSFTFKANKQYAWGAVIGTAGLTARTLNPNNIRSFGKASAILGTYFYNIVQVITYPTAPNPITLALGDRLTVNPLAMQVQVA